MNCVNINSKDFKGLLKETGLPSLLLETRVAQYQDENGIDSWPSADDVRSSRLTHTDKVRKEINSKLPSEVANSINIVDKVPNEILGRDDLYLSIKGLLEDKGITDPLLINWVGINKDVIGNIKTIRDSEHLQELVQSSYDKKSNKSNYEEFKTNKVASDSFDEWVEALEKYPLVFRDIILSHATKYITKVDRESKYVLSLSKVALTNTYGTLVNKPHEANRLGKIYDEEALKSTSDAVDHEPSASGNGYWVHVPMTPSDSEMEFESYSDLKKAIVGLEAKVNRIEELKSAPPKFYKQEPSLTGEAVNEYGFNDYSYVRVESTYSRSGNGYESELGRGYEGYYIHGYNTDKRKNLDTKILAISKEQAEKIWSDELARYPNSKYDAHDSNEILNLPVFILELNNLKRYLANTSEESWSKRNDIFNENVSLLKKLSPSTWCTSGSMTKHYVRNYDNYLLIVNGVTVVGIEASDETNENGKINVNEVTSRNNNGIASIDHLDDTLAFFEKHNLDPDNSTIKSAQNKKDLGKNDKDVSRDNDYDENDFWGDQEFNMDHDHNYEPDYDPEQEMYDYAKSNIDNFILENHINNAREFLNANPSRVIFEGLVYYAPEYLQTNDEVQAYVGATIEPHNIIYAGVGTDYRDNIVRYILNNYPKMYEYLGAEEKLNPEYKDLYDSFLERQEAAIEAERVRVANLTPEEREMENVINRNLPFSKTNNNSIQGYYDPKTDKVIVVAENTPVNESSKVAIHEVAHRGMIRMARELGGTEELHTALISSKKQLMEKLPDLLKRTGHNTLDELMTDYGFNPESKEGELKLLMELSARWSETLIDKPKPSWWKKLLGSIKNWLKKFANITLSESQVDELVGGFVKYGSKENVESIKDSQTINGVAVSKSIDAIYQRNLNKIQTGVDSLNKEYENKPIFQKDYLRLSKEYNDIDGKNSVSRIEIYKVYNPSAEYGNPSDVYVRFKAKDWANREAYDAAEKEYKDSKNAPFTEDAKIQMTTGKPEQLNLEFPAKLAESQKWTKNRMSRSTVNAIGSIANKIKNRFGIDFQIVSMEEGIRLYNLNTSTNKQIKRGDLLLGFYDPQKNTAYLIGSRLNRNTTVHEMFGHPFLEIIKATPELKYIYNQLALETVRHYKELAEINSIYKQFADAERLDESIIHALEGKISEKTTPPGLRSAIHDFWKAITDFFKKLFSKRDFVEEIRPDATLERLADWLLYGEDQLSLVGGKQRTMMESEINQVLDKLDPKRLGEFTQRKITLNEAVKFNNDVTGELAREAMVNDGVYDMEYIRANVLSKLTNVNFGTKSIEYASGNQMATFEYNDMGNSILITDISIKDKSSRVDIPFIVLSIVNSLDRTNHNEVLLRIDKDTKAYEALTQVIKEDAISWKSVDGDNYLVFSQDNNRIANMAALGRKSRLRKAAASIVIPGATSKETSMPTSDETMLSNAETLMHDIKVGLNVRLKTLERNKNIDANTKDEISRLVKSLENNNVATNAVNFIKFASIDVSKSAERLENMFNAMKNGEDISNSDVNYIEKYFLPLYEKTMTSIHEIYQAKDYGIFKGLSAHVINDLIHRVSEVNKTVDDMNRIVNIIIDKNSTKLFSDIADDAESPTMKDVLMRSREVSSDLPALGVFFGSMDDKKSEHLRALDKLVVDVQTQVTKIVATDGTLSDLANSFTHLKGINPTTTYKEFMEHVDGKATGYATSDLLRGQFNKDLANFRKELAKKYGLVGEYTTPTDLAEYKKYIEELDDWKSEHAERMFMPEYYEAKKVLSSEAAEALHEAKENLASFGLAFKNEEGFLDTRLMTPAELNAYHELRRLKNNLTSIVYLNGEEKMPGGLDRQIANEISEFYKKINKGIDYQTRNELFDKTYKEVLKNMSAEDADLWWKQNTKISFEQKFWDQLTSMEKNPQIPVYDDLYEKRKAILNLYRNQDTGEVPAQLLESIRNTKGETLAETVKKLDLAMTNARLQYPPKPGLGFKDIAKIEPSDEYKKLLRSVANEALTNPQAMIDFDRRTTYVDSNGYRQLYSHWTKLMPKDASMIFSEPNSLWSEMDPQSEYINKNFDIDESEEGMVPRRDKYDNSHAYNRMRNNPSKRDFHDKLISAYEKANSNYDYIQRPSKYRLAQIPGKFFERVTKGDRFLSGLIEALKDQVRWRPYDYIDGDYDTKGNYGVDGSKVRFVPTKYRQMLDDRDSISRDLLGAFEEYYKAAVNFSEMSKHADDIETMLSAIKRLSVKDSKNKEIKGPGQSNIYNRAQNFVSNTVYGDQMANQYGMKVLKGTRSISMAKPVRGFVNYVRKLVLSMNVPSIVGNFTASAVNLKTEAVCGIWLNNGGLNKGMRELALALPSLVTSDLHSYSNNKLITFMRALEVTKSQHRDMQNLHGLSFTKNLLSNFHYGPYTAGDLAVKGPMMVGVLSNFKMFEDKFYSREQFIKERFPGKRSEGELVFDAMDNNMYDAFEVKDGNLKIKQAYAGAMDERTWNYAANVIHSLGSKLDGTLTHADKSALHADAFGSAFTLNKGWMQVAIRQRLSSKKWNYRLKQMTAGNLRNPKTSTKILMSFLAEKLGELGKFKLLHLTKMNGMQDSFEPNELYNFRKTLTDVLMLIAVSAATLFAGTMTGGSDDDKKRSWAMFLYVMIMRTNMELGSTLSAVDAIGLIQNTTTVQGPITELKEISDGIFDGTLFTQDVQSGRYMYIPKWKKSLIKLTPGYRNYFQNFVKPDLKANAYFMSKNMSGIYDLTQGVWNLIDPVKSNKNEIKDLEYQKFENKKMIDKSENTYKPLGYKETEQDKRDTRINKRKKAMKSRGINMKIKHLKKEE